MFKFLISDCVDPYTNLATEEELLKICPSDYNILFLWQNDSTIVLGRNQEPRTECEVDEFIAAGGLIAKRRSGGGAVYHDMGNLCYSLIGTEDSFSYQDIILKAFQSLNVDVEHNGRNDFTIRGKKISGNASYLEAGKICQHGTILVSANIDAMEYFLTPQPEKLIRNHVASVKSRVMNLRDVNPSISLEDLRHALIKATNAVKLTQQVREENVLKLSAFYKSHDWIYGGIR